MSNTITIPADEYMALQRLVGFAQSITNERYVTHEKEAPYERDEWHHPVTPHWRESLKELADKCERLSERKVQA